MRPMGLPFYMLWQYKFRLPTSAPCRPYKRFISYHLPAHYTRIVIFPVEPRLAHKNIFIRYTNTTLRGKYMKIIFLFARQSNFIRSQNILWLGEDRIFPLQTLPLFHVGDTLLIAWVWKTGFEVLLCLELRRNSIHPGAIRRRATGNPC